MPIKSTRHKISDRTGRDLRLLWKAANGPFASARYWNEVLTDDDRKLLGNRFAPAIRRFGNTVGIYVELNPRVSKERATLEIAHELGCVLTPRYHRLVLEIGERPDQPPDIGTRPHWASGRLVYRGEVVRNVAGRARNLMTVLDAFERRAWPTRVNIEDLEGFDPSKARQAAYDLNQGLKGMHFSSDHGIVWRPGQLQRKPTRRR